MSTRHFWLHVFTQLSCMIGFLPPSLSVGLYLYHRWAMIYHRWAMILHPRVFGCVENRAWSDLQFANTKSLELDTDPEQIIILNKYVAIIQLNRTVQAARNLGSLIYYMNVTIFNLRTFPNHSSTNIDKRFTITGR